MSEERKKKSGAAWKAEEDEKLNKSRAFVELTVYIANASLLWLLYLGILGFKLIKHSEIIVEDFSTLD